MTPRIHTSEPSYRASTSQWQSERARGELQPMTRGNPIRGILIASAVMIPFWAAFFAAVLS